MAGDFLNLMNQLVQSSSDSSKHLKDILDVNKATDVRVEKIVRSIAGALTGRGRNGGVIGDLVKGFSQGLSERFAKSIMGMGSSGTKATQTMQTALQAMTQKVVTASKASTKSQTTNYTNLDDKDTFGRKRPRFKNGTPDKFKESIYDDSGENPRGKSWPRLIDMNGGKTPHNPIWRDFQPSGNDRSADSGRMGGVANGLVYRSLGATGPGASTGGPLGGIGRGIASGVGGPAGAAALVAASWAAVGKAMNGGNYVAMGNVEAMNYGHAQRGNQGLLNWGVTLQQSLTGLPAVAGFGNWFARATGIAKGGA